MKRTLESHAHAEPNWHAKNKQTNKLEMMAH